MGIEFKVSSDHSSNQLYSDYIQPFNQDLFSVVNPCLEEADTNWAQKRILDYGCNIGNLLRSADGKINQKRYTGIDVQERPLEIARTDFPDANWVQYNGYHKAFNPLGDQKYPEFAEKFDYIFCIGVFQHMDITEILDTLEYFKTILAPNGRIIFSLWERKHWLPYSTIFLPNKLKVTLPQSLFKEYKNSVYLVDRERAVYDTPNSGVSTCSWFESFYDYEYFVSHFQNITEIDRDSYIHSFLMI
jgi:2-polyprenyl-3-methyl-5-hydroxy-6-metoxy-1,4-benzoquinol methylase